MYNFRFVGKYKIKPKRRFSMQEKNTKRQSSKKERTTIENVVRIETDPLGMYTGVPKDPADVPVQDADDL